MWLLFEFYLSTDIDNIILIKAVKIATDTIEISEGLTYEADLNGL